MGPDPPHLVAHHLADRPGKSGSQVLATPIAWGKTVAWGAMRPEQIPRGR